MKTYEGIDDNLRFLIIEVEKQIDRTAAYYNEPSNALLSRVAAGDDYIDNLKTIIQSKSFAAAAEAATAGDGAVVLLKTYEIVAVNLERISDFCERLTDQLRHIEDQSIKACYDFGPFFEQVRKGVELILDAMTKRDVQRALAICRTEDRLDDLYGAAFRRVLLELRGTQSPQTLVTLLFIAHYLERMGDSLLNIGEAILSACLGERIKIGRLKTLESSLGVVNIQDLGHVSLRGVGETKSGARVSAIADVDHPEQPLIFKEGKTKKLVEEKESVSHWNELVPGLAPRIYSFQQGHVDSAALFEYLPGRTFEDYLLRASDAAVTDTLGEIQNTLTAIWDLTRRDTPVAGKFIEQMRSRLPDVWAVHPEFAESRGAIGHLAIPSFDRLVELALPIDERHQAPFAVYIHGDFNVDNVLFDAENRKVHFIDLHRSRYMDYVQDVSVFLASNLRLQVFDASVRRRVNRSILSFYDFAKQRAALMGDTSFEIRLALGMARSFVTSTRFVLDSRLSKLLFHRGRYLLERLIEADQSETLYRFVIPKEVFVD